MNNQQKAWRSVGSIIFRARSIRCSVRLCVTFVVLALNGCGEATKPTIANVKKFEKTYELSPVTVTVQLDNIEPSVADRVSLSLIATAPKECRFDFPDAAGKLGDFRVVETRDPAAEIIEAKLVHHTRSYLLEPFLAGRYSIPPLTVTFWSGPDEEKRISTISTDEIVVEVKSLFSTPPTELKINDISPPIELPANPTLWLGPAVLLVAGAVTVGLIWCRRRSPLQTTSAAAHDVALESLRQLDALHSIGDYRMLYFRVTEILRWYIAQQLGLHAPEQTTREFLSTLRAASSIPPDHKQLLDQFFRHCDQVKFAGHNPCREDVQNTIESCRIFIVETADSKSPVEAMDESSSEPGT